MELLQFVKCLYSSLKNFLLEINVRMFYSFLQLQIWQNSLTPGLGFNGISKYSGFLFILQLKFQLSHLFQYTDFRELVIKCIKKLL